MSDKIKCGHCGNDGTESSLYLTIDAKWNGEVWTLEEREDEGGMQLDCLACDERTDVPSFEVPGIFPYGMQFKLGRMAAIVTSNPDTEILATLRDGLQALEENFAGNDAAFSDYSAEDKARFADRLRAARDMIGEPA